MTDIIRNEKELKEIEQYVSERMDDSDEHYAHNLAATIRALWAARDSAQRSRVMSEITEKATNEWAIRTLQEENARLVDTIVRKDKALRKVYRAPNCGASWFRDVEKALLSLDAEVNT